MRQASANQIESTAFLKPINLLLSHRVIETDLLLGAVLMVQNHLHQAVRSELVQPNQINPILFLHFVVIGRIGKSESKNTLLLQVGLVNAGEALHYYSFAAQESRR